VILYDSECVFSVLCVWCIHVFFCGVCVFCKCMWCFCVCGVSESMCLIVYMWCEICCGRAVYVLCV